MKRVVVSLCFFISVMMSVGLVAQNNDRRVEKSTVDTLEQDNLNIINYNQWRNPIEQFIGVWSLERTITDAEGKEKKVHPGTFMVVNSNASYTIFVYTDKGAVITSEGNILIKSSNEYIEVIARHVNSSMVGKSNVIEYTIGPTYLHKSFWVEKDKEGQDYNREVEETWVRAKMHEGEFSNGIGYPI